MTKRSKLRSLAAIAFMGTAVAIPVATWTYAINHWNSVKAQIQVERQKVKENIRERDEKFKVLQKQWELEDSSKAYGVTNFNQNLPYSQGTNEIQTLPAPNRAPEIKENQNPDKSLDVRSIASSIFEPYLEEDAFVLADVGGRENRGSSIYDLVFGMQVVKERVDDGLKYNGEGSISNVVFKVDGRGIHQFSCYNSGDPNNPSFLDITKERGYWKFLAAARGVLSGELEDMTDGANLYFNPKGVKKTPSWVYAKNVKPSPVNEKKGELRLEHLYFKERKK